MAEVQDGGSFFVGFRRRREERERLEALRRRAGELAGQGPPAVTARVIADLSTRVAGMEEGERQALKAFVQALKDRKDELLKAEHETEELDFRRLVGEIDDVEAQIRRESLGLRVREQRRNLERDLEEYRALRAFVDAAEQVATEPPAAVAPAVPDHTVAFHSFHLSRPAAPKPPEPPVPVAPELPVPAPPAEPPPAPPQVAASPVLPPLVVEEAGLESIVLNHDFVASAPQAGDLDDLSQLDVLSRSLERMTSGRGGAPGGARPVPMPVPPPLGHLADGLPSSPSLADELPEDATVVQRPPTESQPSLAAQPVMIVKGHDGAERASFVLKLGVSSVGRGLDNEVVLDDRAVSRKHATVAYEPDGTFRITDLGSENGTYVNGVRIRSELLRDGDEVHMGKSTLVFSSGR